MPEKLRSTRKFCLVHGCPYDRVSKGLCTQHYASQSKTNFYHREVGVFEIEAHHQQTMGIHPYQSRLEALAKAVPAWNRADRRVFVNAMLTKYRGELEKA